jgi:cyclic beta-1,2-glucan synthetase
MLVVPTLLTTREDRGQGRAAEVHAGGPDDDLRFALLSDWTDSDSEHVPGDDDLLGAAVAAIAG